MSKAKKYSPLIKKIIGTALLLWAVIFTAISCSRQDKSEKMVSELPQITNKAELNEALSGTERLYAVLNAPSAELLPMTPLIFLRMTVFT